MKSSIVNLTSLSNINYGLIFLNYTGVPCILEDLLINEVFANNKKPIILIQEKYLKPYTKKIISEIIEVPYLVFSDYKDLFKQLADYEDKNSELKNLPIVSQLNFNDINVFSSTIYYHSNQFQIETIKDDILLNSNEFKSFFYYADKIIVDYKNKNNIISHEAGYKVKELTINKGNRNFAEIIPELGIVFKESAFVNTIINPNLQIGSLNQSCIGSPHLLNTRVYNFLKQQLDNK